MKMKLKDALYNRNGRLPGVRGRTLPMETREKISRALVGRPQPWPHDHMRGKHHTDETKAKISLKKREAAARRREASP